MQFVFKHIFKQYFKYLNGKVLRFELPKMIPWAPLFFGVIILDIVTLTK